MGSSTSRRAALRSAARKGVPSFRKVKKKTAGKKLMKATRGEEVMDM